MNTRSSKLSLAAILDTSIGRLHMLATVIMTVHLQPPMEFAVPRSEALGLADGNREGTRLVVVGEVLLGVEAIEISQAARHR